MYLFIFTITIFPFGQIGIPGVQKRGDNDILDKKVTTIFYSKILVLLLGKIQPNLLLLTQKFIIWKG